MYHIYSTAANSTEYVRYAANGPKGINVPEHSVVIKGGSGINNKHVGTALGIHTAISDEDYEWLKEDFSFKQHIKHGYVVSRKGEVHPEVVAPDMVTRDQKTDACPVIPEQFKADGDKETIKPMVNKKKAG